MVKVFCGICKNSFTGKCSHKRNIDLSKNVDRTKREICEKVMEKSHNFQTKCTSCHVNKNMIDWEDHEISKFVLEN